MVLLKFREFYPLTPIPSEIVLDPHITLTRSCGSTVNGTKAEPSMGDRDREKDRQTPHSGAGSATHTPSYTPPRSGTHTPPTPTEEEDIPYFMHNPLLSGPARLPRKEEKRRRSENNFRITDVTLKGSETGTGMSEVSASKVKEKLLAEVKTYSRRRYRTMC
jgi:hypothetical protein